MKLTNIRRDKTGRETVTLFYLWLHFAKGAAAAAGSPAFVPALEVVFNDFSYFFLRQLNRNRNNAEGYIVLVKLFYHSFNSFFLCQFNSAFFILFSDTCIGIFKLFICQSATAICKVSGNLYSETLILHPARNLLSYAS